MVEVESLTMKLSRPFNYGQERRVRGLETNQTRETGNIMNAERKVTRCSAWCPPVPGGLTRKIKLIKPVTSWIL